MKIRLQPILYFFTTVLILLGVMTIEGRFATVVKEIKPQPVITLQQHYFNQSRSVVLIRNTIGSLGAGFFIDTHTIATACHVVHDDAFVLVYKKGSEKALLGKVIAKSKDSDIAILTVATEQPNEYLKLTKRKQRVGDSVYTIGHPLGLKYSLSAGIISHVDRKTMSGELNGVIQIDAPINGGNSGGPVFSKKGEVIGLVSYKGTGDGLGFVIPAKYITAMVK